MAKRKGVSISAKPQTGSTAICAKGEGVVLAPPLVVLEYVCDSTRSDSVALFVIATPALRKHAIDFLFKRSELVQQLDAHTKIEHHFYGGPFVAPRDFVIIGHW